MSSRRARGTTATVNHAPVLHGQETGLEVGTTPVDDGPGRVQFQIRHRVSAAVHRPHVREGLQAAGVRHHVQAQG